jgi:hypothetical protein
VQGGLDAVALQAILHALQLAALRDSQAAPRSNIPSRSTRGAGFASRCVSSAEKKGHVVPGPACPCGGSISAL